MRIYFESLSNANLQAKIEKYKFAADARIERFRFMHKFRFHGVGGLITKFVSILVM
jgi:hypothetical protein